MKKSGDPRRAVRVTSGKGPPEKLLANFSGEGDRRQAPNTQATNQIFPRKVFLGLSGGVDSAVSAALLKQQGYEVVGVYMKNWSKDLPGMSCPWARDLADAKRVAVNLGIDFKVYDFEQEYREKVVGYMLAEYKAGRTPNPDIMCNEEIKFKLFYETALKDGADFIATGHYAQADGKNLLRAVDDNKDQTYFLYRISPVALSRTLFPIGHLKKPEVKKLAQDLGLHVAKKPESMGVCFVGEVGIREFLSEFIPAEAGEIRDEKTDKLLGHHDGIIFYTIGQRHGLYLGGGLPYYVSKKDLKTNTLYVTQDLNSPALWRKEIRLTDVIFREKLLAIEKSGDPRVEVRLRHRAPLVPATFDPETNILTLAEPERALSAGQSAVFYGGKNAEICLGGGIIA
jgi:tRNA-specific 2-thiouridylase